MDIKQSECCKARMIGGVQCEACGSNGKIEDEEREAEQYEDERFARRADEDARRIREEL